MSLDEKVKHILKISNIDACTITPIEGGWLIDSLPINHEEFQKVFIQIFRETAAEKKRSNALLILRKLGKDVIPYLPIFTNLILTTWRFEKKFIDNYIETLNIITGGLSNYYVTLTDHRHLADLASLLEVGKNYDLSILCWKQSLVAKLDFFFANMRLSHLYAHLGDFDEALLSLWTGIVTANFNIPTTTKGKFAPKFKQDLVSLLDILEKKMKQNYILHFIRGLTFHYFVKDFDLAIHSFLRCLKLKPTFVEAQYKLANSFDKAGNFDAQIKTYERILKENPGQKRVLHELASIFKVSKDYHLAAHYYELLFNLEPGNSYCLIELISLYRTSTLVSGIRSNKPWTRDLEKAYFYFKKLLKTTSEIYNHTNDFYNLLTEMKKFEEAKELLFEHLSHEGQDESFMRKLKSVYLWLELPFDLQKITQELNYRRNKDTAYPKILDLLSQVRPNIPITLPRIAKFVDFPENRMEELLQDLILENPDVGEYLELEQVFIRNENTEGLINDLKVKYSTCYHCGMPLELKEAMTCSSCDKEILKCSVCKLPISFGEAIGQCSLCETKGHLVHLEEWVKTQGKCPICLQDLPLEGVIPIVEKEIKK